VRKKHRASSRATRQRPLMTGIKAIDAMIPIGGASAN
jgi:F0F1-type ATP synthase alpha subunit